jgi:hypothetical protein
MELPGVFELTKREQRAVILILMALLAAAIVKHYRDQQSLGHPTTTISAEPNVTPSANSAERETEPDE